jgi:hypothetical protein
MVRIRYPEEYVKFCYRTPDIIDDIKDISSWDDQQFLGSTRTLDDSRFWEELVLK